MKGLGNVSEATRRLNPGLLVRSKAKVKPRKPSVDLSPQFLAYGIPPPVKEFVFHPTRKWRFDWAWPEHKIALEIDGGLFMNGRHSRGKGREEDYVKDFNALLLGWRVVRVSTGQMKTVGFCWVKSLFDAQVKS